MKGNQYHLVPRSQRCRRGGRSGRCGGVTPSISHATALPAAAHQRALTCTLTVTLSITRVTAPPVGPEEGRTPSAPWAAAVDIGAEGLRGSERGRAIVDNAFVFGADGVLSFVNPTFDAFAGVLVVTVGTRSTAAAVDTLAFVYVGANSIVL